jgi:hypothetical protein
MMVRAIVLAICVAALFLDLPASNAQSSSSGGVDVSLSKVLLAQRQIVLQFIITNKSNARVYLRDARSDEGQYAFLGSGPHLIPPQVASLNACNNSVTNCLANPNEVGDLNKFSYVEPGDKVGMSFTYFSQAPVDESDTISLSVALIGRFATPSGDPLQAGKPVPLRFNFPGIHLNRR